MATTEGGTGLAFTEFGEPGKVLQLRTLPRQPLEPGEVRVKVHAVGLNFLDVMLCRGEYPVTPEFPTTPGVEFTGTVIETTPGTENWLDREVVGCPALPNGALREEVVISSDLLFERPSEVAAVTAAALPVTYQTSWFALQRARIDAGQTVVVFAAAGGVGTATTQLAKRLGARVIGVARGKNKTEQSLAQGADEVLDAEQGSIGERIRELTDGAGADIVIDPVGGVMTEQAIGGLGFEGRYVLIGQAGGPATLDPLTLMAANIDVIGLSWGSIYPWKRPGPVKDAYQAIFDAVRQGSVAPVISEVLDLHDAPAALDELGAGKTRGKLVVRMG